MSPSQTHFQNAHHFDVHNSQFFNIINNPANSDPVSTILWPHVAAAAIFDSAEHYAAGKCHPGTRKKILESITRWVVDNNTPSRVLWLHGPAGAGKSAIEHTMCELLKEQHPHSYGASFFFRSGHTDCGNARKLFTTLAYQLAIHFPSFRSQINDALSRDPSLPTKAMDVQFFYLIVQPLMNCQSLLSHSPILVIDGLDECANDKDVDTQRHIVMLIGKSIVEHNLPLRVMIASRPEFWIRDAFDTAPLPSIIQVLSLRDDVDADNDIQAYLIDGFEKIRIENERVMGSVVTPWPPIHIINYFVYEASGQYIYAATVLKFVGKSSRFINPQKQLEIITSPGPHRALGFSELDRLYRTILSAYPQLETMKHVLGRLLVGANTSMIKAAFGVDPNDLSLVLDALSSLFDIQLPRGLHQSQNFLETIFGPQLAGQAKVSFCHRSFREFLLDETRSGAFHIDMEAVGCEIVGQFFDMLDSNLDQKYEIEPHRFVNIDHFTYHDRMLDVTSDRVFYSSDDSLITLVSRVAERVASFNPGYGSPDPLLSFMRDLERVESVLEDMSDRDSTECTTAYGKLQNAVDVARQRAMGALSLYSAFKVTPTLVYLAECKEDDSESAPLSMDELFAIPGSVDTIATIAQHHHFLRLFKYRERDIWSFQPMNLKAFRDHGQENDSRILVEWKAARISLVYHFLKLVLNSELYRYRDSHLFLERFFFNLRETSDISSEEYFQNAINLSILDLMANLEMWTSFWQSHRGWESESLIVSILCWFNRQLTNHQTLDLLRDYDSSLQERMDATMTFIFEQSFLSHLTKFNEKGLYAAGSDRSVSLKVHSLPQGFHQQVEERNFLAYDVWHYAKWQSLLDEVFGKTGSQKSAIDPLCWHPLLSSRLLFTLVRFLYGQMLPEFSTQDQHYEESFPYLIQCLPSAKPTQQNLDAIRAIVYLYPQSPRAWDPPEGFWLLIMDFLQKYDQSILSSEELDLFMLWLESPDHADITTYMKQ